MYTYTIYANTVSLQDKTVTVITKCDYVTAGPRRRTMLDAKVYQAADNIGMTLLNGYVCLMSEPVEDEALSSFAKLKRQLDCEDMFFSDASTRHLLSDNRAGISSLIFRLNELFLFYLKQTWVPDTIYLLTEEIAKNEAESLSLGVPEADPDTIATESFHEVALKAYASSIESVISVAKECVYTVGIQPLVVKLSTCIQGFNKVPNSDHSDVCERLDNLRSELRAVTVSAIVSLQDIWRKGLHGAFTNDKSQFKFSRFTKFVDFIIDHVTSAVSELCDVIQRDVESFLACNIFLSSPSITFHQIPGSVDVVSVSVDASRVSSALSLCVFGTSTPRIVEKIRQLDAGILMRNLDVESCWAVRVALREKKRVLLEARDHILETVSSNGVSSDTDTVADVLTRREYN